MSDKATLLWILILASFSSFGQSAMQLHLRSGVYSFPENSLQKLEARSGDFVKSPATPSSYDLLVRFNQMPKGNDLASLSNLGISLHGFYGENTFLANIPANIQPSFLGHLGIDEVGQLPGALKIDANLSEELANGNQSLEITIISRAGIETTQLKSQLTLKGLNITDDRLAKYGIIKGTISSTELENLANLTFIQFIEQDSGEAQALNYNHLPSSRISPLNLNGFVNARGLTGKDVVIGLGDGGEVATEGTAYHIDRNKKIYNETSGVSTGWGYHADHIAGTISGLGNLDPVNSGIAPEAAIVTEKSSNIMIRLDELKLIYDIQIINGSFGPSGNSCLNHGDYTANSAFIDAQANQYEDVLHIFAAGNSGEENCNSYATGFHTVLKDYASAKNALTVGSVKNKRRTISGISSKGPVSDGRLKPEITAAGVNVTSTIPGNNYELLSGTSMATPNVSASLALLIERYKELNGGQKPDGGLLKAIACNTARDVGNPGPDYTYGFGVMNARRAVEMIEEGRYLSGNIAQGQNTQHTINVPAGAAEVKVMLYWVDKPGSVGANDALVNNLNLSVYKGAESYLPWILNPSPIFVDNNATRGTDDLNNIEQVSFQPQSNGTYTIEVNGQNVPFGPQKYYITYEVLQPSVVVTHPYGGEKLDNTSFEDIRWDAFGAGSENVTISVSLDGGLNWSEVPAFDATSDAEEFTRWTLPQVNTSRALVKVSIDGTNTYDISNHYFTVAGVPQNLAATGSCEGTVTLTWDPVPGIDRYEVLVLDTTMKVISTSYDNRAVISGYAPGEELWFSVRSKLEDGAVGRAGTAVNLTVSATPCTPVQDVAADVVLSPKGMGREFTSNAFSSTEIVSIQLTNFGNTAVTGFPVFYQVNNGPVVQQQFTGVLLPGESQVFAFGDRLDINSAGTYSINAWTGLQNDIDPSNDVVVKMGKATQIENNPVSFPIPVESFETASDTIFSVNDMAIAGLSHVDFSMSTTSGRIRTNAGTGFTNGNRAATLDAGFTGSLNINELIMTYNMDGQSPGSLLLNFDFMHHGQEDNAANSVFIRGSDTNQWLQIFDLDANQGPAGIFVNPPSAIDLLAPLSANGQSLTSSFQIRFCQAGMVNAEDPFSSDGYTFDNIELTSLSLPIELTFFHAKSIDNKDVLLEWETLTETNNKGFEVQMAKNDEALNNEDFSILGFVNGAGTTSDPKQYSMIDKNANLGTTRYYRLKQEDIDGSFTYSEIVAVHFTAIGPEVNVFPNPVVNEVHVKMNAQKGQEILIQISDGSGRLIRETLLVPQEDGPLLETIKFDENWTPGMYFLSTTVGETLTTNKILKIQSFQ